MNTKSHWVNTLRFVGGTTHLLHLHSTYIDLSTPNRTICLESYQGLVGTKTVVEISKIKVW